MKVRYAGKNQVFWGVLTILMALGVYTDRIMKDDISVYQLAFMYTCAAMFIIKSVDWDEIRYESCCHSCRPNREGKCNDAQCHCHISSLGMDGRV